MLCSKSKSNMTYCSLKGEGQLIKRFKELRKELSSSLYHNKSNKFPTTTRKRFSDRNWKIVNARHDGFSIFFPQNLDAPTETQYTARWLLNGFLSHEMFN